ncbi:hypothetical protein [Actinomycetospora sp. CA-053990]|uniref:hypothetical protein n=1 Tax=Actinomycetospora sp. CA-053990 TaxID=3239891 RepID=UPI003D8E4C28
MVSVAGRRVPAAKVGAPALPTGFVPRDHLSALVEAAVATAPVTTLRAHAGAGKTLLLADWARTSPVATAWVALDPTDDRPGRLPAAVAHAVAACVPDLAGALVGPPSDGPDRPPTTGHVLAVLDMLPVEVRLVLDDVQELTDPAVLDELETMIRYRPARLRLVLSGRTPPPVPLARLRLEGGVVDLPGDRLRFSVPEVTSLLSRGGARMSSGQVERAHALTGGWAAGISLVAAAARRSVEVNGLLAGFPRGERATAAYLRDEVLGGLSESDRTVLEDLSVATTVAPSLAVELTGRHDAVPTLERLERETSLVAVDPDGHVAMPALLRAWFHGELDRRPAHRARLHVRAAEWSAANDLPAQALEHARASGDDALLARLVRGWAVPLLLTGDREPLRRSWAALAPATVDADPGCASCRRPWAAARGRRPRWRCAARRPRTRPSCVRCAPSATWRRPPSNPPSPPQRGHPATSGHGAPALRRGACWRRPSTAPPGSSSSATAAGRSPRWRRRPPGPPSSGTTVSPNSALRCSPRRPCWGATPPGWSGTAGRRSRRRAPRRPLRRATRADGTARSGRSPAGPRWPTGRSCADGRTRPATTRPTSSPGPVTACTRPRRCSCTSSTAPPTWTRAGSPTASRRCRRRAPRSPTGSWWPRRPPWRRSSSTRPRSCSSGPRTPGPSGAGSPRASARPVRSPSWWPASSPRSGVRGGRDGASGARAPAGARRVRADPAPRGRRRGAAPRRG